MSAAKMLRVEPEGDRELVMTRVFDAPRELVFRAFVEPELLRRWLLGLPGWEMTVCDVDLRVGGKYRWVWRHEAGQEMGMGGVYLEIKPPERLVSTEKFDDPWYPGEAVGTIELVEKDGKTTLMQTLRYESREARDAVLRSPMESGVEQSYSHLADLLAAIGGGAGAAK